MLWSEFKNLVNLYLKEKELKDAPINYIDISAAFLENTDELSIDIENKELSVC